MKLLTVRAVLAAALFSAVVVIPFLPMAKTQPLFFTVEARIASSVAGAAKIYYDLGGSFNEIDAVQHPLIQSGTPRLVRFPLPPGSYRGFRFDPIDGAGTIILEGPLRILSEAGRVVRTIALSELQPLNEIASVRRTENRLEVTTMAAATDPQLSLAFSPPLSLVITTRDLAAVIFFRVAGVFVSLILVLLVLERSSRIRRAVGRAGRWMRERPTRSVAIVAAVAVVASAYPVVFFGKSYVSPNYATTLLYGAYPTLPGYTSSETASGNGSDMGATMWQHVPYSFVQRRALAEGELPLWNRYNGMGTPLLAQGQSMFGDPLHWLVLLFNGASWAWDVKYLVAKWLFATALGSIVLVLVAPRPASGASAAPTSARSVDALGAAWVVAGAAPFMGFFLYRINHAAFFSVCYAPAVLYCWVRMIQAVGRRAVACWTAGLFVANLALMNSGTIKEAYLLAAQMNLTGACALLMHGERWRVRGVKLAAAAWAGTLLLLVTAPIWGVFLETLRQAFTVSMIPSASQLQPALLLGTFDELFFRPLSPGDIVVDPSLNFLLLLGLLYFLATLRLHLAHRMVMAIALCALVALSFAFGLVPPRWIVRVPLLANVGHIENCFLCGLIVLGSVLGGVGFATAAVRLRTPAGRGDLVISGVLLFALVFAWIGYGQAAHRIAPANPTASGVPVGEAFVVNPFIWGSLAALLLASVVLGLVARGAFRHGALGSAGAVLAVLCVLVLLWRQGMHLRATGFERYGLQPPVRASFQAKSPAIEFVQSGHLAEPGRVFGLHANLTPGWNAAYGLEAIQGPDALQNPWVRELIDVSPMKWYSSWQLYLTSHDAAKARPFLDALNVRYYLDLQSDQALLGRDFKPARLADLDVYESASTWPRAFFTDRLDTHTGTTDLMRKLLASHGRPFASVAPEEIAKQSKLQRLADHSTKSDITPATHYHLTENSTSFQVHASSPGLIVLSEAWWPDSFRATIDGNRVPLVRVNHAFKGVLVDQAGDHHVKIWYWPRHFLRKLMLSGSGVMLLVASLYLGLRPGRERTA